MSSSSASGFVSEADMWWEDVVKGSIHKRARPASSAKVDRGGALEGVVGKVVPEKVRPAARGHRRVGGDNVLEIVGGVVIVRVMRHGECVALSLQCNRHKNASDKVSDRCARDLTLIEDLSVDEAVRRLKRWYVAGLSDADWDRDREREQHSKLGGKSLRLFADANPDWGSISGTDLDMLICQSCE